MSNFLTFSHNESWDFKRKLKRKLVHNEAWCLENNLEDILRQSPEKFIREYRVTAQEAHDYLMEKMNDIDDDDFESLDATEILFDYFCLDCNQPLYLSSTTLPHFAGYEGSNHRSCKTGRILDKSI